MDKFEARFTALEGDVAALGQRIADVESVAAQGRAEIHEAVRTLKSEVRGVRKRWHALVNVVTPLALDRKLWRRKLEGFDKFVAEFHVFRNAIHTFAMVGVLLIPLLAAVAVEVGRGHLDLTATAAAIVSVASALGWAREKRRGATHHEAAKAHEPPRDPKPEEIASAVAQLFGSDADEGADDETEA